MAGINETKEVITLAGFIASHIIREIKKDGFQYTDLASFLKSDDFDAVLKPAVEGMSAVPVELTDLNFFEGVALSKHAYDVFVEEIIDALKGK